MTSTILRSTDELTECRKQMSQRIVASSFHQAIGFI